MKWDRILTFRLWCPTILATILLCLPQACSAQGRGGSRGGGAAYTIIPFAPDGVTDEDTSAIDLNDVGEAVGYVTNANGPWELSSSYHVDLGTVPATYTPVPGIVWAINNSSEMVGFTSDEENPKLGYYLSELGAVPLPLAPLSGYENSVPWAINDAGIIVGECLNSGSDPHDPHTAVAWRPVINAEGTLVIDGPVPLFPLEGVTGTTAMNVNDPFAGGPFQIVGRDQSGESGTRAVTWTIDLNADGTLAQPSDAMDLGSLVSNSDHTRAYGNNDLGDVCGDSGSYPMIKPFDSAMQPLQLMTKSLSGDAYDVNALAQVVGSLLVQNGNRRLASVEQYGCLWVGFDADPIKLEKLIGGDSGWDSLNAGQKINSSGVIAGYGVHNGRNSGFIMTPIP